MNYWPAPSLLKSRLKRGREAKRERSCALANTQAKTYIPLCAASHKSISGWRFFPAGVRSVWGSVQYSCTTGCNYQLGNYQANPFPSNTSQLSKQGTAWAEKQKEKNPPSSNPLSLPGSSLSQPQDGPCQKDSLRNKLPRQAECANALNCFMFFVSMN